MKRLLAIAAIALGMVGTVSAQPGTGPDNVSDTLGGRHDLQFADSPAPRAVYSQTNAAEGNEVLAFHRSGGELKLIDRVRTRGVGTGVGLGSQGAVALSRNGRLLFVVNAGSDTISVFGVGRHGLVLIDRVSSGGDQPISLALHHDLLYVLNAGSDANITGFRVERQGRLHQVRNSRRPLSGAAVQPAEVQFNNTGDFLAVTEKASNKIDLYVVDDDVAKGPSVKVSNGMTPFGFAFDRRDRLVVSEAFGDAPGASAVSSYDFDIVSSPLAVISASVKSGQTSACWVAITRDGRYAYVANTGSATITGYRIARSGQLSLLRANGISARTAAGSMPQDLALTRNQEFLFVLTPGTGAIDAFKVAPDGSLVHVSGVDGVPSSAQGLATH